MIHDTLTYRFLTKADTDEYLNFVKSFDNLRTIKGPGYMFNASESPITVDVTLADMIEHENFKIAGAFDGNKIVSTISGYFTEGPLWYSFNQHSKINSNSLLAAVDFHITSMKVHRVLMNYSEDLGIFNFYIRRRLSAQRSIDKVIERIVNKGYMEFRYERYYDGFYPAGKEISLSGHDFYRAQQFFDSILVLYCLKQSEREKIMSLKFPEHFS